MAVTTRYSLSMDHSHSHFAADVEPALRVRQGVPFELECRSLLSGGGAELPRSYEKLVIPVTGPVEIEGVVAGDVLRVDVHEVRIANRGAMVTLPTYGAFTQPLAYATKRIEIAEGFVRFAEDCLLPVAPMIGKIGVGVPGDPPRSSTVGGHGGNMDCKNIGAGSAVLLPVQVAGARLYAGDLHARQGDGESSLTAVEVEGTVTLACRTFSGPSLRTPVVLADGQVFIIGDGEDLAEAVRGALDEMLELVMVARGWTREEAAMLISVAADVGVCELVNPRVAAKVGIAAALLRPLFDEEALK